MQIDSQKEAFKYSSTASILLFSQVHCAISRSKKDRDIEVAESFFKVSIRFLLPKKSLQVLAECFGYYFVWK